MQTQRPIISNHRLARFIAWVVAVLAWCALGRPKHTRADRRHHKRYGALSIDALTRLVRNAIILRALQLLCPRRGCDRRPLVRPASCAPGFKLGKTRRVSLRRLAGAWLRRVLKSRGSFAARIAHLIDALCNYRELAACLAWRRRRFAFRAAVIVVAPAALALSSRALPAPCAADTS